MKIVNCYSENSKSGIGDFIRGSIHLYNVCKDFGVEFDIDVKYHPISKHISTNNKYEYSQEDIECFVDSYKNLNEKEKEKGIHVFTEDKLNRILQETLLNGGTRFIFSNFHNVILSKPNSVMNKINNESISKECSRWFKENIIFSDSINSDSKKLTEQFSESGFDIIHFRMGDMKSFHNKGEFENHFSKDWEPDFNYCLKLCSIFFNCKKEKIPLMVMSDCNELKTFINNSCSEKKILSLHSSSFHTQKNTGLDDFPITNLDGNYYTALDLKIFSMALSIRSFSVYFWGSGFSSWISKIYGIPFYCKPLIKPLF